MVILTLILINIGYGQSNMDVIKVPDADNPGETIDCGLEGSAHDSRNKLGHLSWIGNPQKNRYDIPDQSKIRSLKIEELIASDADKSKFTPGTPVQVTAYVYNVKAGAPESCNCGTNDQDFMDTHIELTPNSTDTDARFKMIVEVSPRLRMLMSQQGVDWSTTTLIEKIKHHTVTISGWLFYDEIHESQSFSTNPENRPSPKTGKRPDWRASCWEIHPITNIEVLDVTEEYESTTGSSNDYYEPITPTSGPLNPRSGSSSKSASINLKSPSDLLSLILIGAILGIVGQGLRMIVGLKKLNDMSESREHFNNQFDRKKLLLSLIYAFVIGAIGGVLMAIDSLDKTWDKSTIIAIIGAGYAGADFIEGFLSKNFPSSRGSAPTRVVTSPPSGGGISQ